MSNPLLLDIVLYLQALNLVQGDGVDAFRDTTPTRPDNVVVLHEYASDPATMYDPIVNRSVQVTVRNKSADAARAAALRIYSALYSDTALVSFTSERWGQVYLRQTPFKLSVDDTGRTTYVFNMGVTTSID